MQYRHQFHSMQKEYGCSTRLTSDINQCLSFSVDIIPIAAIYYICEAQHYKQINISILYVVGWTNEASNCNIELVSLTRLALLAGIKWCIIFSTTSLISALCDCTILMEWVRKYEEFIYANNLGINSIIQAHFVKLPVRYLASDSSFRVSRFYSDIFVDLNRGFVWSVKNVLRSAWFCCG